MIMFYDNKNIITNEFMSNNELIDISFINKFNHISSYFGSKTIII